MPATSDASPPDPGDQPLRGGDLNAAITGAIIAIHHRHLGRGPRSAQTFFRDNIVVTVLFDVMTHAEKTLVTHGAEEAVTNMRHLFQRTMAKEFVSAVERLTGARVTAFVSGNNAASDIATETFIMDRPIGR